MNFYWLEFFIFFILYIDEIKTFIATKKILFTLIIKNSKRLCQKKICLPFVRMQANKESVCCVCYNSIWYYKRFVVIRV